MPIQECHFADAEDGSPKLAESKAPCEESW